MKYQIINTPLEDLVVIKPNFFSDERGGFLESWNKKDFKSIGVNYKFKQDNHSISHKGVIRGLHFQTKPKEQSKLVRVVNGAVIDIVVDIRKNSKTFGQHFKIELSSLNKLMLMIPPGFAHGFISLENHTTFLYKCDEYYSPSHEKTLMWDDETINIDWELNKLGISNPILSPKDLKGIKFSDL
jgi:dTDP-4-dehydrorhamnose 3,5-epimerase